MAAVEFLRFGDLELASTGNDLRRGGKMARLTAGRGDPT